MTQYQMISKLHSVKDTTKSKDQISALKQKQDN